MVHTVQPDVSGQPERLIADLTRDLTPDIVQGMIDNDISLWWDCLDSRARNEIRQAIRSSLDGQSLLLSFMPNSQLAGYVYRARPDLVDILKSPKGHTWLESFFNTLKVEVLI